MASLARPGPAGSPAAREPMTETIRKRRVYLLTGYEPLAPSAHHHRFAREIRRFEKTWSVNAAVGDLTMREGSPVASWAVTVAGPDFRTETDVRLLRWDDIIAEDMERPMAARLPLYLAAAGDILLTGTFFRYTAAYWRYALFAGYPLVLLLGIVALAWLACWLWTAAGLPGGAAGGAVAGGAVAVGLTALAGRRLHLNYMLSDWIFARDMIRRRRPAIEARIAAFGAEVAAGASAGDVDEVVVVGHSLGAAWMAAALARALDQDPELARRGFAVGLAGVGSSTLKIALHPAAGWLRDAVRRVADEPAITWAEYDSHVDFICFYKNNTVEALGLEAASRPVRRSIRLSRMLSAETWGRFRGNLLRIHRQYVMGNEQRYAYDFHMIACGPFAFADIVTHGDRLPAALGPDGSLAGGAPLVPPAETVPAE